MPSELITTPKLSERYGASQSYWERLRSNGMGPRWVRLGRRCYYAIADVEAWLESEKVSNTSEHRHRRNHAID